MTDITQTPDSYPEGVYQLAVTDPVLGGPEGPDNKAAIALANRTNYQRMRNVTPWRPGLENEYPAHAYVQHAGTTWKSKVANANVEPGTDAAKWIRWAYTADELLAFLNDYITSGVLNPYALDADLAAYLLISQFDTYVFNKGIRYDATLCPDTGPAAAPTLGAPANVRKSGLGEIWMYLDNTWRVVANKFRTSSLLAGVNLAAGVATNITSLTAPRDGRVELSGVLAALSQSAGGNILGSYMVRTRLGVPTQLGDTLDNYTTLVLNQLGLARPFAPTDALAGDVFTLVALGSNPWNLSPSNGNALYMQYLN